MSHTPYLLTALEYCASWRGFVAPNPAVGAVIVKAGEVIAKGAHKGYGLAHAEVDAINQCQGDLSSATLYVTLEPCNHYGKTPPCVLAIIESGIKKVVFAYKDPNPVVKDNDSTRQLIAAGIEVEQISVSAIDEFYQGYDYWVKTRTPWVTIKMAQSIDGGIGLTTQSSIKLTDGPINAFTHQQRRQSDVLLTTSQTVMTDNPQYTARGEFGVLKKTVAILDSQLSLSPDAFDIFASAEKIYLFHDESVHPTATYPKHCQLLPVSRVSNGLNLTQVLEVLGEMGCHHLWVEVGARCFSQFVSQSLANRIYIYVSPRYLGQQRINTYPLDDEQLFENSQCHWQDVGGIGLLTIDTAKEAVCLQGS